MANSSLFMMCFDPYTEVCNFTQIYQSLPFWSALLASCFKKNAPLSFWKKRQKQNPFPAHPDTSLLIPGVWLPPAWPSWVLRLRWVHPPGVTASNPSGQGSHRPLPASDGNHTFNTVHVREQVMNAFRNGFLCLGARMVKRSVRFCDCPGWQTSQASSLPYKIVKNNYGSFRGEGWLLY